MIEMLVGLQVTDDSNYAKYREGMTPILKSVGGGFGYDLKVSEVLKNESDNDINRVFTIHFPDEDIMNSFFSNNEYLAIKKEFFKPSVSAMTLMATYQRT
jgi:uncharacterized protein (DUF1330 family)